MFEGADATGKRTQTEMLFEYLRVNYPSVRKLHFPVYDSESSTLVQMYLQGKIGSLDEVNPYAVASFYSSDRYISYITDWKEFYDRKDSIVIADRYTQSNIIHQMCKLNPREWELFIKWLYELEYKRFKLPQPDMVIYLDVDIQVSTQLLMLRPGKKDIHESNKAYLNECRKAGEYGCAKLGWEHIQCDNGKNINTASNIHKTVIKRIEKILK